MKHLRRFFTYVNLDVKNENETKRASVTMRLFSLIMCAYSTIFLLDRLIDQDWMGIAICALLFIGYIFAFQITYINQTSRALSYCLGLTLLWVCIQIHTYGWDVGGQHFVFPILVLLFVASSTKVVYKIICAVILCILRIAMHFYCLNFRPKYILNHAHSIVIQMINTIAIFIVITVVILIFSQDSIQMEEKLVEYNRKLKAASSMDPLTNMFNRRAAIEYLQKLVERNYTYGNWFNIAIGDIDFFKKVNDTYGHEAGDAVLKAIAELINKSIKGKGLAARWGGEEFLLVYENINGEEALEELETLRMLIQKKEIIYNDQIIKVTMTFGLDEYDNNREIDHTINNADKKLYLGKKGGRNQVVF